MRASPAFLTAEDLLEQAWDENADPLPMPSSSPSAACGVSSATPPVIQTQPGVGYHITG